MACTNQAVRALYISQKSLTKSTSELLDKPESDILRRIVVEDLARNDEVLKGELEVDEAYFGGKRKGNRGRGSGGKTIVYGILEREGKVSVNIVQDVSTESLKTETIKR